MATRKKKEMPAEIKKMAKVAGEMFTAESKQSDSSLPFGEFAEMTKGFEPRSRMADTREANTREKEEFIQYYSQRLARQSTDRLSVAPEHIPAGMSFMWARKYCRGQYDGPNMRRIQDSGWRLATPDQMPAYAYHDDLGGLKDDAGDIENGGLVAVLRYEELTKRELEIKSKESKAQNNAINHNMKTVAGDLHPFSQNSRINPNDPFQFAEQSLINTPTGQDFRRSFSS